jgi:hypothetical protein
MRMREKDKGKGGRVEQKRKTRQKAGENSKIKRERQGCE